MGWVARLNPCEECLKAFGRPLCEGMRGCVYEDVPPGVRLSPLDD